MFHSEDELHIRVIFLLLTHLGGGWSQVIGSQLVMAMVGEDVVLPCPLDAPVDPLSMTLEWGRPDLEPRFVHVWHNGQVLLDDQNEAYKGRTSLSINDLKSGDISLKLSTVKTSDTGRYRCYNPKLGKEYFVELLVAAVSWPAVSLAGLHRASAGAVLLCESGGWYPEPELLWLDAEGNLLSAGAPESVRGPDDLYALSGRATVEKRHGNSFTCRVHQKSGNRTRDAHITVPDDFFVGVAGCAAAISFSVLFGFMFVLAVLWSVWKLRHNEKQIKKHPETRIEEKDEEKKTQQPLMEAKRRRESLVRGRQEEEEELRKKEEEQKDLRRTVETLTEVNQELKKQKDELSKLMKELEEQLEENEKKLVQEKETNNQGQMKLLKEKKWTLSARKEELQQLHLCTDKLLKIAMDEFKRCKEKQENGEKHIQQMKKLLEER